LLLRSTLPGSLTLEQPFRAQAITVHEETDIIMAGEIFNTAFLAFTLILVGLSLGFLLLKLQGGEE
jgi:cytochrome b6-f complex subunit 7